MIPKRRKRPEDILQQQVLNAFNYLLPKDAFFTHFPLGGGGKRHGAKMKRLGAKRGTPDLCVLWGGNSYWIELKSKAGRVSSDQFAVHQAMIKAGAFVDVIRDLPQLDAVLRRWGIPQRSRIQ